MKKVRYRKLYRYLSKLKKAVDRKLISAESWKKMAKFICANAHDINGRGEA